MNKVLAFLEKHVQWIALGLGGLFLGYMIWAYVIQTPVLVTGMGPVPLTPGEVDPHILDNAALPLDRAMKDPSVPEMAVPNFIDAFKADMGFTDFTAYVMSGIYPDSPVVPIPVTSVLPLMPAEDAKIDVLPTLPVATVTNFSSGKSNIQPFGTPAAGNPPPPVPPNNPGISPVNNPANNAGPAALPIAGSADKSWVTVSYKIPAAGLAKAFKDAHIPAWTEHTSMLEVQLFREESLPGGKWSEPAAIAPINPQALTPYPPAGDVAQDQTFITWAQAHAADILQPAFYQVNKGDQWHAPGQTVVVVQPVLAPLDPTQDYPLNVLEQYPPDQKLAYFQAKAKLKAQNRNNGRPQQQQPPTFSPPGPLNRNFPARNSPDREPPGTEVFADNFPIVTSPAGNPNPPGPGAPNADPNDLATLFPIPPGDFDPNALAADITGWAHDDTVVPGHTYRYSISYRIKNPIFGAQAANIKPALSAIFDIQSPLGPWSTQINVASTTNFFVYANSRPGALSARIKVYKWQDGVERSHVFEVEPGDVIGGQDADVDYATGWTVVDLRFDDPKNPESMTVIVMSPNGAIDRRDYNTDQKKPELKALDQQVSQAATADQIAGGTRQ